MKCEECGGKLKSKTSIINLTKQDKERYKEKFGKELPEIKGYNCIRCGQCYDEDFKKEQHKIGWL